MLNKIFIAAAFRNLAVLLLILPGLNLLLVIHLISTAINFIIHS